MQQEEEKKGVGDAVRSAPADMEPDIKRGEPGLDQTRSGRRRAKDNPSVTPDYESFQFASAPPSNDQRMTEVGRERSPRCVCVSAQQLRRLTVCVMRCSDCTVQPPSRWVRRDTEIQVGTGGKVK